MPPPPEPCQPAEPNPASATLSPLPHSALKTLPPPAASSSYYLGPAYYSPLKLHRPISKQAGPYADPFVPQNGPTHAGAAEHMLPDRFLPNALTPDPQSQTNGKFPALRPFVSSAPHNYSQSHSGSHNPQSSQTPQTLPQTPQNLPHGSLHMPPPSYDLPALLVPLLHLPLQPSLLLLHLPLHPLLLQPALGSPLHLQSPLLPHIQSPLLPHLHSPLHLPPRPEPASHGRYRRTPKLGRTDDHFLYFKDLAIFKNKAGIKSKFHDKLFIHAKHFKVAKDYKDPKGTAPDSDSDEKPYVCSFDGCSWAFARQSDLHRHARSHTEPGFHCPYWRADPTCHRKGGSFTRLDILKRHLRLMHFVKDKQHMFPGTDPGWCRACQKMFASSKEFIDHCVDCSHSISPAEWRTANQKEPPQPK